MSICPQIQEWGKGAPHATASGKTCRELPESCRGFLVRAERQKLKVYCLECQKLCNIVRCTRISEETAKSSTYHVILDCLESHARSIKLAVNYMPTELERRGFTRDSEFPDPEIDTKESEIDPDQVEVDQIRRAWNVNKF